MNITLFFANLHFYTSILMCSYVTYIFTKLHRNFCVKSFIRSLFGRKLQCSYIVNFLVQITLKFGFIGYPPGNTKGGSITELLTSCLTGLYQSVLQIKTKIGTSYTADSKPVKQEVNGTVILPLQYYLLNPTVG